jgi:hypothetical protein
MLAFGHDIPISSEPKIETKVENILFDEDEFRFDNISGINLAIEIFT